MSTTGEQYAAAAEKLIGLNIPYVKGGQTLKGMDCDGMLRYIEKQLDLPLPSKKGTNFRWRSNLISEKGTIEDCTIRWGRVPLGTIICIRKFDGDEVKHGYTDGFNIDHVYVKIASGLVHASASNGRVIFRDFADKEIPNGGPNTYCMRADVAYTGTRTPSDTYDIEDAEESEAYEANETGPEATAAKPYTPAAPGAGEAIINTEESDLRLRKKPSTTGAVIDGMPKGAIVKVLEQYGSEWTKVRFISEKGTKHEGWCMTKFLLFG